MVIRHHE